MSIVHQMQNEPKVTDLRPIQDKHQEPMTTRNWGRSNNYQFQRKKEQPVTYFSIESDCNSHHSHREYYRVEESVHMERLRTSDLILSLCVSLAAKRQIDL
jgi:hypothetical protein